MAMRLPASDPPPPVARDRTDRIMRWTFRRQDETVVCELGLDRNDAGYEIRVNPPCNPTGVTTETFHEAIAAFERHAEIERCLIEEGWSLESFESGRVPR
jgi:hypothetical protein